MGCWYHILMWRIPDYIIVIILAIVAAVIGAKVRPHCRPFRWDDPSIGYPHHADTFPMYSVVIAVVLVALVYVGGELLSRWRRPLTTAYKARHKVGWIRSMLMHLNGWILVQAYSILLAFAIVNISKVYAGRLRPDFLARLRSEGFTDDGSFNSMVATGPICKAAKGGRVSFPSGHSGTIFSGYVPPVLYLIGLTRQLLKGNSYFILTLCLLPLILPIAVAISRTIDYRHHFDDVLCGSLIGSVCGVLAVLFSFRPSDTGEWTLRAYAVDRRDYGVDGDSKSDDDSDSPPSSADEAEQRSGPPSLCQSFHSSANANAGDRGVGVGDAASSCGPLQPNSRTSFPSANANRVGHQPESNILSRGGSDDVNSRHHHHHHYQQQQHHQRNRKKTRSTGGGSGKSVEAEVEVEMLKVPPRAYPEPPQLPIASARNSSKAWS